MGMGYLADSCSLWFGFDISVTARSYAQFTGILAGFAFVVALLVQSAAVSFKEGMEVPFAGTPNPE
ncbi:hypothetical protein [Mycobacterium cookii]|nr:hypothetical protein [Mycobacterium cookii]MCV7330558.1 hypothetical protein [Mycobacterium cookii]